MTLYTKLIAKVVPGKTDAEYAAIEEIMRSDVFHSTLDWQTSKQFTRGAKEAARLLQTYREMGLLT